jgi:hypothetical protein
LTKTTALVFNTGRMNVSISQLPNTGLQISLDISKLHGEMVDTFAMKFSSQRIYNGSYSDYSVSVFKLKSKGLLSLGKL